MTEAAGQVEKELEACFQRTRELCENRDIVLTRLDDGPGRRLNLRLAGKRAEWTLEVDCTWPRTTKLPDVVLRAPRELLAHVGWAGLVCVNDSQGLSLDEDRQADVVAHTVQEAFDLLESSAEDAYGDKTEFFNELEGYWSGLPGVTWGRSAVEVDEVSRHIVMHVDGEASRLALWYFTDRDRSAPPEFPVAKLPWARAMYAVLVKPVQPPKPGGRLDAADVERVLSAFSPEQKALWQRCTSGSAKKKQAVAVLVSVPRPAGGRSVVGLAFTVHKGKVLANDLVTPIAVLRHTVSYMRERGGASMAVAAKHIVVFGCGSVGSEVADALASSGIGRVTLVDPDFMSEDNVFRHALGRDRIGWHKVAALREELMRKYPGLVVEEAKVQAQEWLANADLSSVDGFVSALGLPTLERSLTRRLRAIGKALPMVVTWLEPLDLGGHSLLFSTTGEGCLDCVYRNEEGADALTPHTAFLAPGQAVTRNLTGCSSIFVPYGAIQSRRTALLAAEQVLLALDSGTAPAYAFWAGDGIEATRQGLQTTPWWSRAKSTPLTEATKQLFGRPCQRCRSGS